MHRKVIAIAAAGFVIGLAQMASAADLPRVQPAPPPYRAPVAIPIFSWTGCYVGINLGGHLGRDKVTTSTTAANFGAGVAGVIDATTPVTLTPSGFVGGGQLGCNFQSGMFVAGLEGDIQWLSGSVSRTINAYPPGNVPLTDSIKNSWLSTVRGRIGAGFDRTLLYVTGGAAFGALKATDTFVTGGGAFTATTNTSTTRIGWTVGAGFEYAFGFNWTMKVEYLYVDLGSFSANMVCGFPPCTAPNDTVVNHRYTDNIIRMGLNFKF